MLSLKMMFWRVNILVYTIYIAWNGGVYVKTDENADDMSVLEFLYTKYKRLMMREALLILRNKDDAEDAVQLACLKMLPHLKEINFKESGMICNFIKIVVRNAAIDTYRKKIYLNTKEDFIDSLSEHKLDEYGSISDLVIEKESIKRIDEAINKLPDKYREIILLEKVMCYSREDTMKMLGESYETLKKRMTRAKSKLLEILKEEGLNDGREKLKW